MTTIAVWILAGLGGFTLVSGIIGLICGIFTDDLSTDREMAISLGLILFSALMFWLAGNV